MTLTRRDLIRHSAVVGATGAVLLGTGQRALATTPNGGYGPLVADTNPTGPRLDLPSGFSYRVTAVSHEANGVAGLVADTVTGGAPYPDRPDGTGSFPRPGGGTILVQNHEITASAKPDGTYYDGAVPKNTGAPVYDANVATNAVWGGTTTLEIDAGGNVLQRYVSIAGTAQNCAGGVTPWGSWLTCEETETTTGSGATLKKHGYVFEVDPAGTATTGLPLTAMGRFAHEAVAIDPATKYAYLTEDASGPLGLLYRFKPTNSSGTFNSYAAGGTLEAMACNASNGDFIDDLAQITTVGTVLSVTWVPVPDPDFATVSVRKQFPYSGAPASGPTAPLSTSRVTRSKKFEGIWWGNGTALINASFAKTADLTPTAFLSAPSRPAVAHDGAVWEWDPTNQTLTLRLRYPLRPTSTQLTPGVFDGPDNIVVSPHGGAFLCEDGDGLNYIVGLDTRYAPYAFGLNRLPGNEEFTGANFSADGTWMFVNTQVPGVSYAITGPWDAPPSSVPEVGKAILLPASAAAIIGGALLFRQRRMQPSQTPS